MSDQPIATAEDFRRKAKERLADNPDNFETPEIKAMPSGLNVLIRRPKLSTIIAMRGVLPKSLAAIATGQQSEPSTDETELADNAAFVVSIVEAMVVEPKIRQDPQPGEVHPNLIGGDDFLFLIQYATGGEATSEGNLETFPGGAGSALAGAGSGPVEDTSVVIS